MRKFTCQCASTIFFENTQCLTCGSWLGFEPESMSMLAIEPAGAGTLRPKQGQDAGVGGIYRFCANAGDIGCNWLVHQDDPERLCRSCRLNRTIPNLAQERNEVYWTRIEAAKRRLVYSLLRLELPMVDRRQDPEFGLAFDFLADARPVGEFSDALENTRTRVMTGHNNGVITINVAEADDVERERVRAAMGENYRTLLGHFRHEIAHFYWPRLLTGARLEAFRALFGDERENYSKALERHYANGPLPGWATRYVSAYASSHPWEDWAESFAHYLHMTDTLEAAAAAGVLGDEMRRLPTDINALLANWRELVVVLNSLNRCMGQPDAYPFVLSGAADVKIAFVHDAVQAGALGSRHDRAA